MKHRLHKVDIWKIISTLSLICVIALDDAFYHNVEDSNSPTPVSNKKSMQDWLTDRKSPFSANMFKTEQR